MAKNFDDPCCRLAIPICELNLYNFCISSALFVALTFLTSNRTSFPLKSMKLLEMSCNMHFLWLKNHWLDKVHMSPDHYFFLTLFEKINSFVNCNWCSRHRFTKFYQIVIRVSNSTRSDLIEIIVRQIVVLQRFN